MSYESLLAHMAKGLFYEEPQTTLPIFFQIAVDSMLARFGLLSLTLFLSLANVSSGDQPELERRAFIEEDGGGLVAKINFGDLQAGSKVKATLELVNNSPISLPVKRIQTSCNYISVRSEGEEIPANGSLFMDFTLDVVKDSKQLKQTLLFSIFYAEESAISVYVSYQVSCLKMRL
ncbi:DUF1573 domain-containing protein [Aureliella helgolandensis]|uniref:HYDIN/VesB/CFA65-like Ig-like domain-containing protein n=1 Tax=Aureliella helgolandensis TaxID=2527968 RepID=A0A518G154_9BACT|nr:DUF1573 domain-containing protein [Aureliella helgolandensis]QDV22338.1 hypothetical protein Q31a_06220 [Aureliella helgolandensis]